MNHKILILGKGFIGLRLQQGLRCALSERRIRSLGDAESEIESHRPQTLINCIGHTGGATTDACEEDPDKSLFSNAFVPLLLAEACLRRRVRLVHISTGCIYHFDRGRDRGISEERIPDFFDLFYSRTKIYPEAALETLSDRYDVLIPRLRVPLDSHPHPGNLLTKLLGYRRVIDVPNSVSYLPDFIDAIKHLISTNAHGIYNIVNRGGLRYPALLEAYKKQVPEFTYDVVDFKDLGLVRTNLVLATEKLERSGFPVRHIDEVLDECVKAYTSSS